MGDKKQRIIPAHYSWNSSIITRGVIDPIKRKLGWVDENERPVSLKESATGQEWDRVKDTAKGTGKLVATGLAFGNPITASSTMAPFITGSQAYFMTEGLKDAYDRITSPNKTAADGAMVALDVAGAVPGIKPLVGGTKVLGNYTNNVIKIANPKYRALHAYNSITPFGYDSPVERTKNWIKDMIVNSPVDVEHPKWIKDAIKNYTVPPGTIEFNARNSAYKKYLGIPDKSPMYIENPDGTFSYDLSKFPIQRGVKDKIDFIGGAHGHLWNDSGITSDGSIYFMHDVWDLHPLSKGTEDLKESLHKTIGSDKLRELAQNFRVYMFDKGHWGIDGGKSTFGKLTQFLDRPLNRYRSGVKYDEKTNKVIDIPPILNNAIDKIVDLPIFNKIAKYEIGPILGGKPFELKMNVPIKPNTDASTFDSYQYITDFKQGGILKRVEKAQTGIKFEDWYKTVPKEKNDTTTYNLRRAFELAPKDQLDAFVKDPDAHLYSVYLNKDTGEYEFVKRKDHPTIQLELDWYNSDDPEAVEFRKKYKLDTSGDYYKYIPIGKSGIHIKPENRGKFTALKKRTGKSSTWYKEHGTPAQKKMAVFALNAKKWKH